MKRELFYTKDGSTSLRLPQWNEQYHSIHGAVQEAKHVFIDHGLSYYNQAHEKHKIRILEMGLGTGLNALLTALYADEIKVKIDYISLEAFPIKKKEWTALNYGQLLDCLSLFSALHELPWEKQNQVTPRFNLLKKMQYFEQYEPNTNVDIVYFDAFGSRVQPELWTESIFERLYKALDEKGILVTYSAKGSVRRLMEKLGFIVERLPGPPGKREMLRGIKQNLPS